MKKLSVIIPVFNEEKTIVQAIERVLAQEIGDWQKEIIVVDDGSFDGTREILKPFFDKVRVFQHGKNLGKGTALRTGFAAATGQAIIVQDADLEYDPADWPKLLKELEENPGVGAVYGSRELSPKRRGYSHYVLGVRFLAVLINLLFGSKLTDPYTCYKLLWSETAKEMLIESNGFEVEAEITVKLLRSGKKIREVPIQYYPRRFSEGKKIRAKDGFIAIWTIIKHRLR